MSRAAVTTPAVVTGVSNGTGLGIARDLGELGVPVLALDNNADALGFVSRYAAPCPCRDPFYDEDGFLEDLVAAGRSLEQKAVLFPAQDDFVATLARQAETLGEWFLLPFCDWTAMQALADKEQQVLVARAAGVPTPATAFIHEEPDLDAAAASVPFPAVLKPTVPLALKRRLGLKLVVVDRADDLPAAYADVRFAGALMLQEVVPGADEDIMMAAAYHDAGSRPLAVFTGRKLRQHPRGFGTARLAVSEWSDEVADLTLRVLAAFRYHGVSDVEFKRDGRDGELKFMEVNARHGLFSRLATAAGVNLSATAYLDALGRPVTTGPQRDGVVWCDALREIKDSLREVARREMSAADWLWPLAAARADAVLSVSDPAPSVREVARILRRRLTGARPGVYD